MIQKKLVEKLIKAASKIRKPSAKYIHLSK